MWDDARRVKQSTIGSAGSGARINADGIRTQGIAELRNHYGTGHGKAAGAKGLSSRHAKLAVGAAASLAVW
jgi:hypothetical protein